MQSVVDELKHYLTPFYSSILQNRFMFLVVAIGEFKGAQGGGACPLPPENLAPDKFQARSFGTSRIQENVSAAGAPPGPRLGSLRRYPDP